MRNKKEYKTVYDRDPILFDKVVNASVRDGWDVDFRGMDKDGFAAFLSRELPEMEAPAPKPISSSEQESIDYVVEYFKTNSFDDIGRSTLLYTSIMLIARMLKTGKLVLAQTVMAPSRKEQETTAEGESQLPRLYTEDEMWLAYEKGKDVFLHGIPAEEGFEEFLEGLKTPRPEAEKPAWVRDEIIEARMWSVWIHALATSAGKQPEQVRAEFNQWWETSGFKLRESRESTPIADPLEKDIQQLREILKHNTTYNNNDCSIHFNYEYAFASAILELLRRIAGMEASNG